MNLFFVLFLWGTAFRQSKSLPSANLSAPFNDVIILSSKNLNCYSCSHGNLKSPECTCQSSKCLVKSISNNSTFSKYIDILKKKAFQKYSKISFGSLLHRRALAKKLTLWWLLDLFKQILVLLFIRLLQWWKHNFYSW